MATLDELLKPAQAPAGQTLADLVGPTVAVAPIKQDPGYVETGLRSLARGGLGLASGVGAASEWAGDVTDSPNLRTAGRMIQESTQKEISEGAGRLEGPAFEGTFVENPSVKRAVGLVSEAVPSIALAVGTGGLAAGGLRAAGMAAPKALAVGSGVAAGGLGVLEGAPQYIEAKEAGKSIGEASAAGAAATVGTALLEYLPISKILGVAGKGSLKGGVTGALTEGLQEGAQTVWQNLVAKVGYDDSRSLATGLVESMIGGAGAGGVVGAVAGRVDAKQHTKDRAAETLIKNAFPDTEVSVDGGQAKLIREVAGGTTDLAVPLESLAKMVAAGVTIDELFSAKEELKAQVDAATAELPNMDNPDNALAFFEQSIPKEDQAAMADVFANIRQNNLHKGMSFPQQLFNMVGGVYESRTGKKLEILGGVNEEAAAPKFARLEDGPDTLRYNIRGKDYAYSPLEGQTVDDLRVGVEGKSPAAAVNWLKKNSQLVKEVPNVQTDQVVPESVVPQAKEVVAPVARGDEVDAGGVPGEPVPATVQPEQVIGGAKRTSEQIQDDIDTEYDRLEQLGYSFEEINAAQDRDATVPEWAKDLPMPESRVSPEEVAKLGQLYAERDAVDSADLSQFISEVSADAGIGEVEATAALESIGIHGGTAGVYITANTLKEWGRSTPYIIGRLYNHFANQGTGEAYSQEFAEFRWGGTAQNIALTGRAFDEDTKTVPFDQDVLRKVEAVYNAVAKNTANKSIDLSKLGTKSGTPVPGGDLAPITDEAPKLSTGAKTKGQRPSRVKAEIEKKYGSLEKVIASGKLNILRAADGLPSNLRDALYMVAHHGGPRRHDKFSTDYIGSGEGTRYYGWGLYFASAKAVAEGYRKKESKPITAAEAKKFLVDNSLWNFPVYGKLIDISQDVDEGVWVGKYEGVAGDVELGELGITSEADATSYAESIVGTNAVPDLYIIRAAEEAGMKPGALYEVELAPAEDEYLIWDKHLSEQSEKVTAAIAKIFDHELLPKQNPTGREIYKYLAQDTSDQEASATLLSFGVRGNKYLDGSSRNRPLRKLKAEFLAELPEDGTVAEVEELIGTGKFSPNNDALLKALASDDWLGFSYPAQAISATLSNDLTNYDPSPALTAAVAGALDGGTYNYVIFDDADVEITALYSKDGKTVVGAYVGGKVYLIADAIAPGEAPGVFLHEVAHRLLDQDTAFKSAKAKIVADFGKLDTQAAKDARAKVPANTPAAAVGEEGLAYFLQTQEGRKSSLWKRLVAAVRSGLRRLGFDMQYTEDDILEMFTAGARSFVQTEEAAHAEVTADVPADVTAPKFSLSEPKKVMAGANDALSESRKKVGEALIALASPRAKGRELYEKYAPQWLSVTSLHHIAQVFGKNVPQIKSMDRHVDDLVTTKTAIIDRAYAIHKAAEKAASDKDGSGVAKFNRAALTGTFNQMTPWSGLFEQDWVPAEGTKADRLKEAARAWSAAGMNKSTGLTFQEAYRESADAFNALSPMEQIQLQRMVEDTAAIRQRERTNLLKRIELLSEGNPELRQSLMIQFNASFNNLKGMYLPLSRFGDFILEYTNAKGQRVLEAFPDAAQRKVVRETLAGEGVDETTIVERVKDKNAAVIAGMPQELMSQLTKSVESKFMAGVDTTDELAVAAAREHAQAAVSDMNQTFFRWLPDTSAMKNSVRRKNIQGASDNMLRGYLDYVQRHAVAIAWSEVGSKIEQDIQGLANENAELRKSGLEGEGPVNLDMRVNLLNDMRARVKAIRTTNVGGLWSGISKLNTGYFMTSPSAFFVQMTQVPTLTLPKLGAMFGWGKSSKALASASMEAFSKKFSSGAMLADPIVNALYSDIRATVNETNRKEGQSLGDPVFSPAQIQAKLRKLSDYQLQLLTLREAMDRNLLDISAAHEAFELTRGGDPDSKMSRLFRAVMLPMQHGELASRKTAVLATLDLALKSGKGLFGKQNQDGTYTHGAIDDIHEVVKGTLFSYAKEDMGAATQGGAIRTILQFQKFRVFTGLRIARLFLESVKGIPSAERAAARKEFVGIMGMSTLIGGVKGTIYAAPIMAIANLLFGWDDDEPYSAELDFANWMEETFGKTAGDAISHGPLTLMGTNISRRVGLGDIYGSQAEPPPGLHGAALATWWAGSLLGPTFSVAQGWFKGYDQMMNKGNYMRGLEDASPKPVKDALKAFRFATEGVKTGDGRKILSDDEIGVDELLTTFFGFQSDEVARAQAANAALGKMSTAISERRGRLIRDAAEAILSEDGDIEGAIAAVTEHAQNMPRYAITASEIKGAIAKRIKGEFGVTGERELGVAQDYEIGVLGGVE